MLSQVLCTFHTVWEWTEYQIEEILAISKTVQGEHQVKIQYHSEKNVFEIIGINHDSVDRAREDLSRILMIKSSEASVIFMVPPQQKKAAKFDDELVVGLPPPLPHHDPSLIVKRIFEGEEEIEEVDGLEGHFYFSNGVDDPSKVLGWHRREANTPCDYWKEISKDCSVTGDLVLDSRKVHITGGRRRDIEKAIQRLEILEQIYVLRPDFRPKRVLLVHYPQQDVHFKLYFLPLKNHGYFRMTVKSHVDQNVYLLIPAVLDPGTGKFQIINSQDSDPLNQFFSIVNNYIAATRKNKAIPNSNDHQPPPIFSTNRDIYNWPQIPLPREPLWNNDFNQNTPSHFPTLPNISSTNQFIDNNTEKDPNNDNNKKLSNWAIAELRKQRSQYTEATTSQPRTSSSTASSYALATSVGTISWNSKTRDANFPVPKESRKHADFFDEKPYREDMDYKTKRIVLQKSPYPAHSLNRPNTTPGKMIRDYNFAQMKEALVEGMEHVRTFKGEIRFSGSATHEEILYNGFTEVLGNKAYYANQYFEIEADARNSPYGEYTSVTMHINMSYVSLEKVMLQWNRVVDVEWSVLNRISTRKALRHDVKPFNTFIKKASVSPTTRIITFENVPDFLEVKQVKNITVNKYKLHFPFIAEVNRVEILPLIPQKNSNKIQGKTGYGTLYYTIEIYNSNHKEMFLQHQKLATGTVASWTVYDILGDDPTYINMVEFIKTMLLLVERCNKVADDKLKELLDQFKKNP
ncbi:4395_t:CDS:10 [Entrophospora sp. SA101]|nr:4395_t:CDS:10 [Entrophospora sp. SA101]